MMKECIDQLLAQEARAPSSTYRLQLNAGFPFAEAERAVGYLKRLGIGALYLSPIFEARPGSNHGYDVTRHDRLNPELGGEEGFDRLSRRLREAGMEVVLDIVTNHMGVGNDSAWWQDVLENGRSSEFAEYFDIDWTPLKEDMRGKLLLPLLGRQYGEELEAKRIQVVIEDGRLFALYFDHKIPLAPHSLPLLFRDAEEAGEVPPSFRNLLLDLSHLPPHDTADPALAAQRRARLAALRPRLREALCSAELAPVAARAIEAVNGVEGDPRSFDRLHELLEAQPYRLALWRVSGEEVNYRRFFDINDLAGLRMENPSVFAVTHRLVRKLLARRQVTGLRIDHCDGMFNPRQYLIRVQLLYLASQCFGESAEGPTAPNGIELSLREELRGFDWARSRGPLYTVVEKILEPHEYMPREWPVSGTSGYDFTYLVNQVFIQSQNERAFDLLYAKVVGERRHPDEIVYRSKLQVMQSTLASEVYVLTNLLSRIAAADRRARDFTDNLLETVLRETIACFPVYRTYIDDRGQYTDRDRAFIRYAIARAKRLNPDLDASAFDFLGATLLPGKRGANAAPQRDLDPRQLHFTLKFQQLTGPVMAKGVEDTAFYAYNRFLSANEVGGSLKAFGITAESFHAGNMERLQITPDSMLTTSTHDTKRSEDVRARLNVLSEMPSLWASLVRRWQRMNERSKRKLDDGRTAPDANEEYLLYQTIAGAWPWQMESLDQRQRFLERIQQYASKALSEAKVNLSWINPNPAYLAAVHDFLADILLPSDRGKETRFVDSLHSVMPQLELFGAVNSLAQTTLKIASPGMPDFYQGTELWDLSLVDPDNRRPVNFGLRDHLLDGLEALSAQAGPLAACGEALRTLPDGRVKLWTIHRALQARQAHPELFRRGEYVPLGMGTEASPHTLAFLRREAGSSKTLLVVVPRFAYTLMNGRPQFPLDEAWGRLTLKLPKDAPLRYRDVFTGEPLLLDDERTVRLNVVFRHFPVAMLANEA